MTPVISPPPTAAGRLRAALAVVDLPGARPEQARPRMGRNENWVVPTDTGPVFVKVFPDGPDAAVRFRRAVLLERTFPAGRPVRRPRCRGTADRPRVMVFDHLDGETAAARAAKGSFTHADAVRVGSQLGRLHTTDVPGLDPTPYEPPGVQALDALPIESMLESTAAELEVWRLLQGDPDLLDAVRRQRTGEAAAPSVPIHGDLRLDQVLLSGGQPYLTDWEDLRAGDPARDIGTWAGEWFHRAAVAIVPGGPPTAGAEADLALSHREILDRGARELAARRPMVEGFLHGYRYAGGAYDTATAERAAMVAGWHLVDRLIAGAGERAGLGVLSRAAAGIGRAALVRPATAVAALGLAP